MHVGCRSYVGQVNNCSPRCPPTPCLAAYTYPVRAGSEARWWLGSIMESSCRLDQRMTYTPQASHAGTLHPHRMRTMCKCRQCAPALRVHHGILMPLAEAKLPSASPHWMAHAGRQQQFEWGGGEGGEGACQRGGSPGGAGGQHLVGRKAGMAGRYHQTATSVYAVCVVLGMGMGGPTQGKGEVGQGRATK